MIQLQDIINIAEEALAVARSKGYTVNNDIVYSINNRLSRALGRFRCTIETRLGKKHYTYSIEISGAFKEYCDALVNTVRHEVAHYIAYTNFEDISHGRIWKKIASDIGANPQRCVDVSNNPAIEKKERKKRLKIRAKCVSCPQLYRINKPTQNKIQRGLIFCPTCQRHKLQLVSVF